MPINGFSRSDFKFVADRLIWMVIEEGLNQLPYTEVEVTTPTGDQKTGLETFFAATIKQKISFLS